jgi:hypothetical protein
MEFSSRRPLIGSVLQGVAFGVLVTALFFVKNVGDTPVVWQVFAISTPLFALGMYPANRWKRNRPERFGADKD